MDADMAKLYIILDIYDPQHNSQIQVRVKFMYHDAVIINNKLTERGWLHSTD